MSYVIAAPCIADYSCVEICPVNCISPAPADPEFDQAEQLYINPEVCIQCGACAAVCPVLAIYDAASLPDRWKHYAAVNRDYFAQSKLTRQRP
jgi:formate hydrogenlyase subunit 6/NADH:ubiquinone oxidoreductase subunit I